MSRLLDVSRVDLDPVCATLELYGSLLGRPTALTLGEWRAVLRHLPARWQRIVILRAIAGLPFHLIAERLGVSRNRVWQLWLNALDRLRPHAHLL